MSSHDRDPLFESLDRLAGTADADLVGDRMPDIRRRVRVARQRRLAGVGVAAATAAVIGVVAWQSLPQQRSAPPVTTPPAHQDITIKAEGVGRSIWIDVRIAGEATPFTDTTTGEPAKAGPSVLEVYVDGELVEDAALAGDTVACEPGEPAAYTVTFPRKRTIVAEVAGPGEHTVEVRAEYCDDGTVVAGTSQVTVVTQDDPPTVSDLSADVDGDGRPDQAHLVVPAESTGSDTMQLSVELAAGGTVTLDLPYDAYGELTRAVDLAGSGQEQLVISGGGGDTVAWTVVTLVDGALAEVKAVDLSGRTVPVAYTAVESGGGPDPEVWLTGLFDEGFYDYRYQGAAPGLPAPVDVRRWVLSGDTLQLQAATSSGCLTADFQITQGGC